MKVNLEYRSLIFAENTVFVRPHTSNGNQNMGGLMMRAREQMKMPTA